MENFIVSARKYRPATFDTVVGQSHITVTLKNALKNNHLAQAFLFCGPRGVGKTTCARILAKTINCLNPTEDYEACGECSNCMAVQQNSSLNVYELDAASNNSVEDIRNLVEQVRVPPPENSKRKVYIIDEVHMLSTAAFNAFLKTLEEPPSYVIFILATTEKHKIIPTILSRCQIFDFKRIEISDMAGHLEEIAHKEHIEFEKEGLELIAQKADGGLRDALSLFDMLTTFGQGKGGISYKNALENLHVLDYDFYFKVTEALLQENIGDAWKLFDMILKRGFDGHNFVAGLAQHFRDLLVCQHPDTISLLEVSEKNKIRYQKQAQTASVGFLMSALNICATTEIQYKASKMPKLHVELGLMKMAHLQNALNFQQILAEDNEKKKQLALNNPQNIVGGNNATAENQPSYTKNENEDNLNTQKENSKPQDEGFKNVKIITNLTEITKQLKENKIPNEQTEKPENQPIKLSLDTPLRDFYKFYPQTKPNDLTAPQFFKRTPKISEDGLCITFLLEENLKNAFEKDYLEDITQKLQQRFRNPEIVVKTELYIPEVIEATYTNQDRYEYIKKRYNDIEDLKNILGLEVS